MTDFLLFGAVVLIMTACAIVLVFTGVVLLFEILRRLR